MPHDFVLWYPNLFIYFTWSLIKYTEIELRQFFSSMKWLKKFHDDNFTKYTTYIIEKVFQFTECKSFMLTFLYLSRTNQFSSFLLQGAYPFYAFASSSAPYPVNKTLLSKSSLLLIFYKIYTYCFMKQYHYI